MAYLREAMDRVKAEQQARAALLAAETADPAQSSVEITSDYEGHRYTEKWFKQGGVVFRQVDDSPIEATAFLDLPSVRITVSEFGK